jgi:hypothetical protein
MIDTNALNGLIHEKGYSKRSFANAIGMGEQRFYRCMKKGVFGSDDMEKMVDLLGIENPKPIFFAKRVTQ